MREALDLILVGIVWLIVIGAALVSLVAVFGFWGWASYKDAVLFEEKLAADHDFPAEIEYPTDHARRLPEIDLPLDKPDEGEDR